MKKAPYIAVEYVEPTSEVALAPVPAIPDPGPITPDPVKPADDDEEDEEDEEVEYDTPVQVDEKKSFSTSHRSGGIESGLYGHIFRSERK